MIYEKQKTKQISFPLGGIGTGSIGLGGNGELIDWEIFNRPNKNSRNGYSHFAIKATRKNNTIVKVLHGDTNENLAGMIDKYAGFGHGVRTNSLAGLPHFKNVVFNGTFPFANLTFSDDDFPALIKLCAFNPFIPHDDYNSSLPVAFFEWEIQNTTNEDVEFTLAFTVCNPATLEKHEKVCLKNGCGVKLGSNVDKKNTKYSDLCILTDGDDCAMQQYWYRGGWQDGITTYWKNLSSQTRLIDRIYEEDEQKDPTKRDHATIASYFTIKPHESKKVKFVLAWNVPNAYNYWDRKETEGEITWRNYYATQFSSSVDSASYSLENYATLYEKTALFSSALQSSTLPDVVKEAISANMSIIKTPTVLRYEDGSFWAWEGCSETYGSCFGTCQHVWNYAYVMPYLFPKLERSIREMTMNYALDDNGGTIFRITLPPQRTLSNSVNYRSCVDGQMGEVIKCYREWIFSGDDTWLKTYSEKIFSMLEYAWSDKNKDKWDLDCDGVLEGRQHHTLDLELFGPSSWLQGFYLLALDCGAKMAKHLGENDRYEKYTALYEKGKKWTNENLFNGEYFYHKIDIKDKSVLDSFDNAQYYWNNETKEIKYQLSEGCIIDQMLADWHAILIGADGVFDKDKKQRALESLYKYNFKESMRTVANMWRNFALNDESATIICSYPHEENIPSIPISYCDEAMTGFEYALAGLMIANGFVTEGEKMVKAIRDRYDGEKRNPWNEIECGNNYARAMASFALLPIYSGFTFDMTKKHVGFAPIIKEGKFLFSACESWGQVQFSENSFTLSCYGNPLTLCSINVPVTKINSVTVDGKNIDFTVAHGKISFGNATIFKELKIV